MNTDIIMFTMDRHIDRRIVLAAETLMAEGLSVRLYALGDGTQSDEFDWVHRISSGAPRPGNFGLRIYHYLRYRLPVLTKLIRRFVFWWFQEPEHIFKKLFISAIDQSAARVYIAHDLPMLPVALAARARHGGKVLLDSHELFPEQTFSKSEKRQWCRVEARYISQADAIITVNLGIAQEMSRRHKIPQPVVVQNAERFREPCDKERSNYLRLALGIAEQDILFLYQGGLSEARNLDVMVAAMAHTRHTRAVLVLLGDGVTADLLRRHVSELGLEGRVFFHPAVPQAELLSITRCADFGIIPYQDNCLNNRLCTPNKLYEFIMARVPVIASDLPELRRIIAGYDIGLLGETESAEAFACLLDEAFEKVYSRSATWRANLDLAAQDLCWERQGQTYLDVVRSLEWSLG